MSRHLLTLAMLCGALISVSNGESPRPNIIFIMADDLGIGDVSCYGGLQNRVPTPHLDRLAREGVRFTDAHTVASICVPSRVAIMTGRYPWRFQPPQPSGPWGFLNPQFDSEQYTLGKMMKQAGYQTGYVGKWHLGTQMATIDDNNQGPENVDYTASLKWGPRDVGFERSFILPGSLDMFPYAFVENHEWVGEVTAQKGWSAFNRKGPAAKDFEDHQVLDRFCQQAEQFIQHSVANNPVQPFFLYLALTSPHTPLSPSPAFQGRSPVGIYADFVIETDHCIGRILKLLDELKLSENTLILATSDHGPASYAGPNAKATPGQVHLMEREGHFPNGLYRGYKFSAYEGGLRIPLVARWPGQIPAATTCDRLVGLQDLMATLAEVIEVQLTPTQGPDSISFLSLLHTPDGKSEREHMILRSAQAFVIRDGSWKLILDPGSGCPGTYGNRPTAAEAWERAISDFGGIPEPQDLTSAPFVQLFDLENDPQESNNLAGAYPDRIQQMMKHLVTVIEKGRSTSGPTLRNDRKNIPYLPRRPR
jgi:arylsulfatase A